MNANPKPARRVRKLKYDAKSGPAETDVKGECLTGTAVPTRLRSRCGALMHAVPLHRCHRLGKSCEDQAPGSHRGHKRPPTTHNVTLRLESKVDLVSEFLLTTGSPSALALSLPGSPSALGQSLSAFDLLDQMIPPEGNEAILLLSHFRGEMAPLFPFVPMDDSATTVQLRHQKPLLYMLIIMIACQANVNRQSDIARLVRYEVAQAVMVRSEKSLTLLQVLLILVAW
jgi:hypothetical protein